MATSKAVLWQSTWDVCGVQRQLLTGCSLFPAAAALPSALDRRHLQGEETFPPVAGSHTVGKGQITGPLCK